MATPLEKIKEILGPGCKKDTTEGRFNMIFTQLKLLGWKAKRSARHGWVCPKLDLASTVPNLIDAFYDHRYIHLATAQNGCAWEMPPPLCRPYYREDAALLWRPPGSVGVVRM